jgi:hypothetical protein
MQWSEKPAALARRYLPFVKAPYVKNGVLVFIVEGTESAGGATAAPVRGAAESSSPPVVCELSGQTCGAEEMRHHMGAHILQVSWQLV